MSEKRLQNAIKVLVTELKDAPGYYEGWKSNIAMSMFDEYNDVKNGRKTREQIHMMCNKAAEKFLQSLMNTK